MTELQTGTVIRYCKLSTLDEQRNPTAQAFQRRDGEKYLSVYLVGLLRETYGTGKSYRSQIDHGKNRF